MSVTHLEIEEPKAEVTQLRAIADITPTMLLKCDAEERFTFANPAYTRHRNLPLEQILGRTVQDVVGKETYLRIRPYIRRVLKGEAVEFETELPYPGLGSRTVAISYAPDRDAAGQVHGWVSAITDVTEIRKAQSAVESAREHQAGELAELSRKLAQQARMFDATLSHLSDLVYTFDSEGRLVYANKVLLELWGRAMSEVAGKRFIDMGYPEGLGERLHAQVLQVLATGRPVQGETPFRDAAGKEDLHEYVFNPVFDDDGKVVAMAGTTRLITDRRRAEASHRQLAAIVEASDDAIISKSLESVVLSWNLGAAKLFGYAAGEIIGRPITLLSPPERYNEEPEIIARIRRGERIQHYETVRRRKDGSFVEVSLSVSPIRDEAGNIVAVSTIARDITLQKRTENRLKEARDAAEAASRAKDQFLAVLSHELRTPLTPVLMTVAARQMDASLPPEIQTDMQMIRRNIELETRLIDDLLDLSRITSGKLSLRLEVIDLNESMEHVCEICRAQILEKGLHLHKDLDSHAGLVKVDPSRLQQVFWNVLKNAAKFTPEGGDIRVSTRRISEGVVEVVVRDTGAGIPVENLPKIFNAFEQGDAGVTRQFGGLGLGLAISKALVELHGGTIRVESEGAGKGSVFTIELPAIQEPLPQKTNPAAESKRPSPGSLKLLVVEDHADTANMLALLLRATGHRVETATTVADALGLAANHKFDLLISDVGLPDGTGYELMKILQSTRALRGIAMSGFGSDEDMRKSYAAGFSDHLVKPVNFAVLEHTIRRVMDRSG